MSNPIDDVRDATKFVFQNTGMSPVTPEPPEWIEVEPDIDGTRTAVNRLTGDRIQLGTDGKWRYTAESAARIYKKQEADQYDADYFLRGKATGKSLYEDYRWLPNLTRRMVAAMVSYLDIKPEHVILDFGCARGYTVRAFREMGYNAWGHDISEWALANADVIAQDYLVVNATTLLAYSFDWVIAKDVLEHVPQVADTINNLLDIARVGIFAVVPLSLFDGSPYVVSDYEKDITHIHRLCLSSWAKMFMRPGWTVTGAYMVPGVKANYQTWEWGNGFLTARRIKE